MRHTTVITTATAVILALGATAASAAGTSPGKGTGTGPAKKPGQCAPAQPDSRLDQALRNVKIALAATGGKLTDKIVASFAKDMGMSTPQARKFLTAIFVEGKKPGAPKPGTTKPGPANVFTAAQLAKVLGVPLSKAQAALDALQKMATGPKGTIDEGSPAFAAVAKKLGVTPQRLAKAILQLKMAAGGKPVCKPAPGKGDPGKGDPGKGDPGKGDPGKGGGKPKTLILR
ncbi:hypothetical protein [Actinacidiphila bryophytorum]|uniref:Uncharacterized protein n=1 Tax=Actinacidiphila bryophytorum TaxID=1436133 RepID=A0A9W4GYF9_9ACTN|nr:hypothetical protein [Actinacidiphila bryophytorum]MBM9434872.1 hypothetical protein [Actinacidiphila bryophytorum]MBN6547591.1 hypothetical protein [Actinacidiphila bryophytorum]CAG7631042.1 conserved exported hypothetical protein [Actinacidiphila bryophytorum]